MTTSCIAARRVCLDELRALTAPSCWPPLDVESAPDGSWAVSESGELRARCSAWWASTPSLSGKRVGIVGQFAASSIDAARQVLDSACTALSLAGATLAIGPMDGSTWRRYRMVTDGESEPPFFLEPSNPECWPRWMCDAGWRVHTRYFSAVNEDLARVDGAAPAKAERLAAQGVRIRDLDVLHADAELLAMHDVAARAFRDSYLYTPLGAEEFAALYRPILPLVEPRLVSIAEHEGRAVGFCFCVPNTTEHARLGRIESAVLKTFAVLPGYTGLGGVLAARTNAAAHELGFSRVIHALMHEDNARSRALSTRSAREIRRYALFERRLHA
jgi:hypothetical protein